MQSGNERSDQKSRTFIEQARREQILRAATETIAEVGLAKASLARIAAHAGISAALISYHFDGRDDLINQVAAQVDTEIEQALEQRMANAASYVDALRGLITGFVHYTAKHRTQMYALYAIASSARARTGTSNRHDREAIAASLSGLLIEGQQHREFRDFSVPVMAATLASVLESVPRELYSKPELDVDTYAEELAEIFAIAVRRTGRGRRRG
ncbi:TetR/AcrR family transcriptional regulator [Actinoalloteichus hymeniacidonis]|uniref:TetR/AcrR family transcriptional regulator n=1 Tax=Actinoalloteichus hymeniacidonis TaxID=340345 RepID=UPI0008534B27|nr:TetR/AcrR family transcriptional regulator [Actinoalloteichus hymeniacidonis]MBB5909238.1 AcrR family transcriptional regulator [Actinoalloteichus hymeniacidonis]